MDSQRKIPEYYCKHAEREWSPGLWRIMIESMMVAERREYLRENGLPGDKGKRLRWATHYVRPHPDIQDTVSTGFSTHASLQC